jgi:hypothetical protein
MSANRAVQAAQRRRAGGPEPAAPGRGPQPSINSSQLFSQGQQGQMRPGTNGRLAGQQAQLQQQQMQQQMKQQMAESQQDQGLASVNRMTLAQAITLITLRLGKVETVLQEQDRSQFSNSGLDSGIIDVIMSRLEALETQSQSQNQNQASSSTSISSSASSLEVTALKQSTDVLKTAISQSKSSHTSLLNDHKVLKQEVEKLKAELASLQSLTMENNQQIVKLSLAVDLDGQEANANLEDGAELEDLDNDGENVDTDGTDNDEIVGTDLKDLIEKELKL